jgi:hypothetical protein
MKGRIRWPRWSRWLPALLLVPPCIVLFAAWTASGNVAAWLQLVAFCA